MLIDKPGKQCCVIDTNSLVRLCQLELGSQRAIEWILEDFWVRIPSKVFEECQSNLSTDASERKVFFEKITSCVDYENNTAYDQLFAQQVAPLTSERRSSIDEGEAKAAAYALRISRYHTQYVVFITDDYKAANSLDDLLREDQIGTVKNSYDLLLFLRSRHPELFPTGTMEVALNELNRLLRDNSATAGPFQKPDELLVPYLNKVRSNLSLTPTIS